MIERTERPSRSHRLWRSLVVRLVGGFGEWGPLFVCVHDDGLSAGWRRIEWLDLRFVPARPLRCVMRLDPPGGTGRDPASAGP